MLFRSNFQVVKITTEETYALRTAVLRADTPTSDPKYAEDSKHGTVHLGIFDADKILIATSTWVINPWQDDPSSIAIQLRGMAVATKYQKSGLGKLLLDSGITPKPTTLNMFGLRPAIRRSTFICATISSQSVTASLRVSPKCLITWSLERFGFSETFNFNATHQPRQPLRRRQLFCNVW